MTQTLFLGQMWTNGTNGTFLVNERWKSYDNWILNATDQSKKTYYVENTSNMRVLGIKDTDNNIVSLEGHDKDTGKIWEMELVHDTEYFTLIHPHSKEVLTVTTDNKLIVSEGMLSKSVITLLNISLHISLFIIHELFTTTDLQTNEDKCKKKVEIYYELTKYICWGLVLVLSGMEILQFLSKVLTNEVGEYLTRQNILEVIMLIVAVAFFVIQFIEDRSTCPLQSKKTGAQEHLLGWALFLAWIDLTIFLARFNLFGKPIYLSWHVLNNVAWSMIVYIPTVIAFSAGFHCFLKSNAVFEGPWSSVVKTLTMLLGEYDFADNFLFDEVKKNTDSNFSVQVAVFLTDISIYDLSLR